MKKKKEKDTKNIEKLVIDVKKKFQESRIIARLELRLHELFEMAAMFGPPRLTIITLLQWP